MMRRRTIQPLACGLLALVLQGAALGAAADGDLLVGPRDPYVPPDQRIPSTSAPPQGPSLDARVDEKLQARFAAADVGHTGRISAQDARRSGWGYVAAHFSAIDRDNAGSVTFAQIRAYLHALERR